MRIEPQSGRAAAARARRSPASRYAGASKSRAAIADRRSTRRGRWRTPAGILLATGALGLPAGFIVADQLADIWQWTNSVITQVVMMAAVWAALAAWALRERRW